jgi:hypothetical protein
MIMMNKPAHLILLVRNIDHSIEDGFRSTRLPGKRLWCDMSTNLKSFVRQVLPFFQQGATSPL